MADTRTHGSFDLLSLSPELILEITSHIVSFQDLRYKFRDPAFLDRTGDILRNEVPSRKYAEGQRDLGNIRLTCQHLAQLLEYPIFKAVVFDFHVARSSVADIDSRLSALLDSSHPSRAYTSYLRIHGLNPVIEGYRPRYGARYEWFSASSLDQETRSRTRTLQQYIGDHLGAAISSFKILRSVAWNIEDDSDQTVAILGALSSLPSLEDVTLCIRWKCSALAKLQVNRFSSLRSLSLEMCLHPPTQDERDEFVGQLARVVSQSPLLSYLRMTQSGPKAYGNDDTISFQDFVQKIPRSPPPFAHLIHLRLDTSSLDGVKQKTVNLLKSLKVLHLEEYDDASSADSDSDSDCDGEDLWDKFHFAGIELQQLTVNYLSKPLLDYLATFSSLTKLHVHLQAKTCIPKYLRQKTYPSLYETVLPRHNLALVTCRIPSEDTYESEPEIEAVHGILYERRSSEAPPICTELLVQVGMDLIPECLPFLMDSALNSGCGRLNKLNIRYSPTRLFFRCGTGRRSYYERIYSAGVKWLSDLQIVDNPLAHPKEVIMPFNRVHQLKFNKDSSKIYSYVSENKGTRSLGKR